MSTDPAAPLAPAPVKTGWLWVVGIAALISIYLVGGILSDLAQWVSIVRGGIPATLMLTPAHDSLGGTIPSVKGRAAATVMLTLVALTLVPYALILAWLRGERKRKGLALAATTGCGGTIGVFMSQFSSIHPEAIHGLLPTTLELLVPQLLLWVGAYRMRAALRRSGGAQGKLAQALPRWSYLGLLVFLGFYTLSAYLGEAGYAVHRAQVFAPVWLRIINTAETTYAQTWEKGFSPSLAALGPPAEGGPLSAAAAGLVDSALAAGTEGLYTITYTPGARDTAGRIKTYAVTARPPTCRWVLRSFFTDESGVIRYTTEDRPATVKDLPLWGREP